MINPTKWYFSFRKKLENSKLFDTRLLFLTLVVLFAVSVFWNGARIIQQNYELTQKVAIIKRENDVLELENKNKELQNQYFDTDEFADITARRVFGKAAPGEKVYIVPKQVALNALETVKNSSKTENIESDKPQYQKNLESWLNIYLGN